MGDEFERLSTRCNSPADLRNVAEENPSFGTAVSDSVSQVKLYLFALWFSLRNSLFSTQLHPVTLLCFDSEVLKCHFGQVPKPQTPF